MSKRSRVYSLFGSRGTVGLTSLQCSGQPRQLLTIPMPTVRGRKMVVCQVTCPSTGHNYILSVPPRTKTCRDAVAWTFGLDPEKYRPLVEA